MKRLFYLFMMIAALSLPATSYADGDAPVPLKVKPINPGSANNPPAKGPILIPAVYQNGNVLTFDETLEGATIQLLDEEDAVVFSHFIEENEDSLTFPSTLTGTYELQIIRGALTFYCYIEL